MRDVTEAIRERARALLAAGTVDRVLGHEAHPRTGVPIPCVITAEEEVDRLIVSPLAAVPPVRYLQPGGKPTAVVARACDTRLLAVRLAERSLGREDVVVLAVGCDGLVDPAELGVGWTRITGVEREKGAVVVATDAGVRELRLPEHLLPRCVACPVPQPVVEDERFGEFPGTPPDREDPLRARVAEVEALSRRERRAFFEEAFARCIRCYACRQVCALCDCERCTADETRPQWIPRSTTGRENELFLTLRAMHLAGRCTECGACERACPMGLPLMALNTKLALEVESMFGHRAGLDPEGLAPLALFREGDPDLPGHGGDRR